MNSNHRQTRPNRAFRAARSQRSLLSCALAAAVLFSVPVAMAQSTGATLRGQVVLDSAPAADATVTATNTATGLTRSVRVSNGSYSLAGLPPGPYRVEVEAGGQTTSQDVTLRIGQTATLDLQAGGVAETAPAGEATDLDAVVVVGTSLVESRTSEVATYVSQRQIEALPQASRNFLAFADTVPGMIFETGSDGSTKLRGGAQSSNGINVFIDGVGQKNYVLKGGVSGQDSTSGNPFPQLAIGEYKVITSNYKAEYDQISSAAITAVTRSGTNEFEGSFFRDYTSTGWRSETVREAADGAKIPSSEEQYGALFSGPIIRDRLFFLVTYEAKDIDRPRDVRIGDSAFDPGDLTPELAANLGSFTAPFQQDMYFGKLTWFASDDHLLELSVRRRDEEELQGIGDGPNTPSYGSSKTNDSTRIDLRWQWTGDAWLNDFHLTSEDDFWSPRPITIGPGLDIRNNLVNEVDGNTILNLGGGRDFQNKGQKGYSLQNDFTFTGFLDHTIKTGIKLKAVDVESFQQQPFNAQYRVDYYENLAAGRDSIDEFIPWRVEFGAPLAGLDDRNVRSRNKQFGIYLQDDWQVNDKLILNLGIRYDYEETPAFEDFVTPDALVTALRAWPNLQGPNVDYDIEDYISNGRNREPDKDNWAPRLGFSYDLFADQRHVLFGGIGRSYDRNLFDYLALEQQKNTFPGYTYFFDTPEHDCSSAGPTCLAWDPSYYDIENLYALVAATPNLGAEVNLINNELETPYSDQLSIGIRNSFTVGGLDWNTSTTLAHIRSYEGILFTLGNRWPDGSFRDPANPDATWGGQPWGHPIPGFGTLIIADNGIETRLNSLLFSLEKPFRNDSPWSVTLAYTFSDAKENRFNAANADEHYLFDAPDLEGQRFLRAVGVPRHRLVATGIAELGGVTFSSKLTLASPSPKDSINCRDVDVAGNCYFDDFIPEGSIGFKQFDIAVQKVWETGSDIRFRVRGDLLNVFNWKNYIDYNTNRGGPGSPDPTFGDRNGNSTVWPPRMFKLSLGFDW